MALIPGEVRQSPKEILANLPTLYQRAAEKGMNLSHFLERHVDPSSSYDGTSRERDLKAFGRVMAASGIIWRSEPENGFWADTFGEIYNDKATRALLPEFANHVWRKARTTGYLPQSLNHVRTILNSADEALGTAMRPYVDAASVYQGSLVPAIPLSEVVALQTPIDGTSYRRIYLDAPATTDVRWARIGESADIPRAVIRTSERAIDLYKYGRAIEFSYELLRRTPIDKVGFFVAQAALQVENDRFAQAVDVLINGDGNSGTAATVWAQSVLDTGTSPTLKGWLAFKAKFSGQYALTHIFARDPELLNLLMLSTGTNQFYLIDVQDAFGFGGLQAIENKYGAVVRYGATDAVATGKYLGIDRRYALERLTEIGSDISETGRFIERQNEILTFTEVDGFTVLDANANKIWNMA